MPDDTVGITIYYYYYYSNTPYKRAVPTGPGQKKNSIYQILSTLYGMAYGVRGIITVQDLGQRSSGSSNDIWNAVWCLRAVVSFNLY